MSQTMRPCLKRIWFIPQKYNYLPTKIFVIESLNDIYDPWFRDITWGHIKESFELAKLMLHISPMQRCTNHTNYRHDINSYSNWWNQQITDQNVKYSQIDAIDNLKIEFKKEIVCPIDDT